MNDRRLRCVEIRLRVRNPMMERWLNPGFGRLRRTRTETFHNTRKGWSMEARYYLPLCISRHCLFVAVIASTVSAISVPAVVQAQRMTRGPGRTANSSFRAVSQNFIVTAVDQRLANRVANDAEMYRKQLAIEWVGQELPPWQDKCPITVEIGMHAGGETSFAFVPDETGRGTPRSWQMKIFGPPDRVLDAVLPHEITHTIFATHFGCPLPRWADEGACTTVEHESEKEKNHRMLMDFLSASPSRGIPFNRMFTMKNYPHDILPLYAQGHSLAKFLIMQNGRQYFLDYINAGMVAESRVTSRNGSRSGSPLLAWDGATKEFYGYDDLSDLQIAWLAWVRQGSQPLPDKRVASNVALASHTTETGQAKAPIRIPSIDESTESKTVLAVVTEDLEPNADAKVASTDRPTSGSWYVRQSQSGPSRVAANRESFSNSGNVTSRNDEAFLDGNQKTKWRSDLQSAKEVVDDASLRSDGTGPRTIMR